MKYKHFNTFFINIIIVVLCLFPSELSSQEYHDTIAWVRVNEKEFKATDSDDTFSNKDELNALLSSNHVVYYEQALPFAKTPELHQIHEIRLSSQGNIDDLYQTLTNKYPNVI